MFASVTCVLGLIGTKDVRVGMSELVEAPPLGQVKTRVRSSVALSIFRAAQKSRHVTSANEDRFSVHHRHMLSPVLPK